MSWVVFANLVTAVNVSVPQTSISNTSHFQDFIGFEDPTTIVFVFSNSAENLLGEVSKITKQWSDRIYGRKQSTWFIGVDSRLEAIFDSTL